MELARASRTEKPEEELKRACKPLSIIGAFSVECQQALLKKERRAKNSLMELDSVWRCNPIGKKESTINGWADLDDEETTTCMVQINHNKSTSQTIHLKERSVTQTSSLIPSLKKELSRLESPERRKKDQTNSHLSNMQVMSELSRKRKHSLKVAEIIRSRQNRLVATGHFTKLDIPEGRPFTNAENRLNQHRSLLRKIVDLMPENRISSQQPYRIPMVNPFQEMDSLNENEHRRFPKCSNFQFKPLKTSKDFHISKLDQARISKSSFYHERRKDRLNLKNLLDH